MSKINNHAALCNLERRRFERKERCVRLWQQACEDFESIKSMIIRDYEPLRIYQWGSLLHSEQFNENSDIDIGLEGIAGGDTLFRLYGQAEQMTQFALDIVEVDKILPEFSAIIKMKGVVVYERLKS